MEQDYRKREREYHTCSILTTLKLKMCMRACAILSTRDLLGLEYQRTILSSRAAIIYSWYEYEEESKRQLALGQCMCVKPSTLSQKHPLNTRTTLLLPVTHICHCLKN